MDIFKCHKEYIYMADINYINKMAFLLGKSKILLVRRLCRITKNKLIFTIAKKCEVWSYKRLNMNIKCKY
jgi:hypothetical protein